MNQANTWDFVDAWMLTAVASSTRPCSLTGLIETADGLNHAIPLESELLGALPKLVGAKLITMTDDVTFDLTGVGEELTSRRSGSQFRQVNSVLRLLHSVAVVRRDITIEPHAIQAAVDAYLARTRSR